MPKSPIRSSQLVRSAKIFAGISAVALLTACGGSAGSTASLENPGFFTSRTNDNTITGRYNAEGYSANEVRSLLAKSCDNGRLGSYGEGPADGLIAFTATCAGATKYSFAGVEYERLDSGKILVETTFTDSSGNFQYSSEEVS